MQPEAAHRGRKGVRERGGGGKRTLQRFNRHDDAQRDGSGAYCPLTPRSCLLGVTLALPPSRVQSRERLLTNGFLILALRTRLARGSNSTGPCCSFACLVIFVFTTSQTNLKYAVLPICTLYLGKPGFS
jgi:hypothetical protein